MIRQKARRGVARDLRWRGLAIAFAMAVCGLLAGRAPALAQADNYPNRTITIISPYPPGGATSDIARLLANGLQARLGQPVVVENVSGAGGNIGVGRVARATPDGYTILVHNMALASSVTLFPNLNFSPEKDLTGVSLVNTSPLVMVGRKSLPADTLAELRAWMKAATAVKMVQAGTGNIAHLCGVLFAQEAGVPVDLIPYRGGAPAMTDLLGEHVDLFCSTAQLVIEPIRAGSVKGYAVTSKERFSSLPEIPAMTESGMPKLEIAYWHGMWVPAATPRPIVEKLNAAVRDVLADPATAKAWAAIGVQVYPADGQTPEATNELMRSEIARWGQVIRDNKIEAGQ